LICVTLGKDWPALVAAVGNKSLQQVKNFYYDTIKKQSGKQRMFQGNRQSVDDENVKDSESLSGVEESSIELMRQQEDDDSTLPSSIIDFCETRAYANAQTASLPSHLTRENRHTSTVGPVPGLLPYPGRERVGQVTHHELLSNLSNLNPWVAAAQQLLQQSRDPRMRIRDAWALEGKSEMRVD